MELSEIQHEVSMEEAEAEQGPISGYSLVSTGKMENEETCRWNTERHHDIDFIIILFEGQMPAADRIFFIG